MAEPDRVIRRDGEGVPALSYLPGVREGRPWADLLEVLDGPAGGPANSRVNSPAAAAAFIRAELPGWVVSGAPELGRELAAQGATVLRHAHTMRRDLRADPPPADWAGAPLREGVRAVPNDRAPEELLPAWRAAFAPGHVDHFPGDDARAVAERLGPLLAGKVIGPVLPSGLLAVDAEDRVIAGLTLTDRDGRPWVAEVFRDPGRGYRGLGGDLLRLAVADLAARGGEHLTLVVSEGNPARRLYESLGFDLVQTSLTVLVPDAD
ncbi:GNAT family N-acetyltransferase [Streptomyces sp. NRRL WC-3742]|uniref:GNAT family N-acetyltransferase n=1 Tax=Streptomyces sp. NRRL WC-3742 TaxID=1463934 RepID=UPI0004C77570|nr:GNAT family N-acetyltransferase [Streptomyces sp. NRRL WC-3742]